MICFSKNLYEFIISWSCLTRINSNKNDLYLTFNNFKGVFRANLVHRWSLLGQLIQISERHTSRPNTRSAFTRLAAQTLVQRAPRTAYTRRVLQRVHTELRECKRVHTHHRKAAQNQQASL